MNTEEVNQLTAAGVATYWRERAERAEARVAELEAVTKRAAIAGIRAQEGDDGLARIMDDLSKENNAALDLLREVYELAWKNDEAPWRERVAALLSTRTPRETP